MPAWTANVPATPSNEPNNKGQRDEDTDRTNPW
jgi:hypothetical protein